MVEAHLGAAAAPTKYSVRRRCRRRCRGLGWGPTAGRGVRGAQVIFKRRSNSEVDRMEIIKGVADLVRAPSAPHAPCRSAAAADAEGAQADKKHSVDLTAPDKCAAAARCALRGRVRDGIVSRTRAAAGFGFVFGARLSAWRLRAAWRQVRAHRHPHKRLPHRGPAPPGPAPPRVPLAAVPHGAACCAQVAEDYFALKKYNLMELAGATAKKSARSPPAAPLARAQRGALRAPGARQRRREG